MPAVSTVSLTGNPFVDGLMTGVKWADVNISYSFPTLASQYPAGLAETATFQALTGEMQAATRQILKGYAAVSGLVFTEETTSPGAATIRMAFSESAGPTAYGYYPSAEPLGTGGDIWISRSTAFEPNVYDKPEKGNYAWLTIVHELGHALGLKHSQEASAPFPMMASSYDHMEYTVMSYRSYQGAPLAGYTNEDGGYAQSLMMADIAALQSMYGANWTTNAGNTTYTFDALTGEMSIDGVGQGAPADNRVFLTIWDGGGVDTYDFSNYTSAETINLAAGSYSKISDVQVANLGNGHFARGNVYNALQYQNDVRSLIENASGGSANDVISGNQAANTLRGNGGADTISGLVGNDTMDGGAGNDRLDGGAGLDTAIFRGLAASYQVTTSGGVTTVTGADGTDTLRNVEFLRFDDASIVDPSSALALDTIAPTLAFHSPSDNATAVLLGANLVLTFSEAVFAGTGSIIVHNADGSVWSAIDINDRSQVSIVGNLVTVNPSADLSGTKHYYVTIDAGAFTDIAGNAYAGIATATDFAFDTGPKLNPVVGTEYANTLTGSAYGDALFGRGGNDVLNAGAGNDLLDGGTGADRMLGGTGNDTYLVDNVGDVVSELANAGYDKVQTGLASYTLTGNVEDVVYTGTAAFKGYGNASGNVMTGNNGNDVLAGLAGDDTLVGGNGSDSLTGGLGQDRLQGDGGVDRFIFAALADSGRGSSADVIADFLSGTDRIDLSGLDADAVALGNQAFRYVGASAFSGARGELQFLNGIVSGDVNGDRVSDFEIQLANVLSVTATDFIL